MEIKKRTFEAKKFPKWSGQRAKLNEQVLTSEYLPSYKYVVIEGDKQRAFRTKSDAKRYTEDKANNPND